MIFFCGLIVRYHHGENNCMTITILIILVLAFFMSCTKMNDTNSSKNIIRELVFKYPELSQNYDNEKSTFNLDRQIIDNEWRFKIE